LIFRGSRRLLGFALSAALASSNVLAAQRMAAEAASEADAPYTFQTPRSAAAIAAQYGTLLADLNKAEAQLAHGSEAPVASLLAALDAIDNFEDVGVALAPAQQRVSELNDKLSALTQRRRELVDLEVLRAERARHLNQPLGQTVLVRWDAAFYCERVARATDAVDQEQFRRYFLTEASLRCVFAADRLSPAVGCRYRETVLESGGQVAPGELMQRFLGLPANSRTFFKTLAR
jgi:Zn-dependent oligopeptidase